MRSWAKLPAVIFALAVVLFLIAQAIAGWRFPARLETYTSVKHGFSFQYPAYLEPDNESETEYCALSLVLIDPNEKRLEGERASSVAYLCLYGTHANVPLSVESAAELDYPNFSHEYIDFGNMPKAVRVDYRYADGSPANQEEMVYVQLPSGRLLTIHFQSFLGIFIEESLIEICGANC